MLWEFGVVAAQRLLIGAGISIMAGLWLWINGSPFWRAFGIQWVLWGGLVALIALGGWIAAAYRLRHAYASSRRRFRGMAGLFWFSTGLDLLLVVGGVSAVAGFWGRGDIQAGSGWGAVTLGGWLSLYDLIHAIGVERLWRAAHTVPGIQVYAGERHQAFTLAGGKPAALVVHGFPGTPDEVRQIAEALNHAGWTVEAMLLPGYGSQMHTLSHYHYLEWVSAIQARIAALRRDHSPLALVGFSMGGSLSICAVQAAAEEDQPDALVLLAPYTWALPAWQNGLIRLARLALPAAPKPLRLVDFRRPRVRWALGMLLGEIDQDDANFRQALRDFPIPLYVIEQARSAGRAAQAQAVNLKLPVLVVQGDADDVVNVSATRRLVSRMGANTEYIEIPGLIHVEPPGSPLHVEVERVVTAWLEKKLGGSHSDSG